MFLTKILLKKKLCMHVSVCGLYMRAQVPVGIKSSGTGVIGSCQLPVVDVGKQLGSFPRMIPSLSLSVISLAPYLALLVHWKFSLLLDFVWNTSLFMGSFLAFKALIFDTAGHDVGMMLAILLSITFLFFLFLFRF